MNAVEIRNLSKNFKDKRALDNLNMTVPVGSIYGFIGENGSGKSTTEKIICGLIQKSGGEVKLFQKELNDEQVREKMGVLIEAPGCFPNISVYQNLLMQASNLEIANPEEEVKRVLKLVRMEGAASNKFKNCSLGMKQRIGIAMALMGSPKLLVLDEPINGLDLDGMRIMREVFTSLSKNGTTIIISSHVLGELEKVATHYGIIRNGKMIREMTADELDNDCPKYVAVSVKESQKAKAVLSQKYARVEQDEKGYLRVYDAKSEEVLSYLYSFGIIALETWTAKISLEEYYINLMNKKGAR